MANDIQAQKPWKVNQISNDKPSVPQTDAILSGYFANSLNGGHNKPIFWKKIMAGEKIKQFNMKGNFQMLTPLTPTYQNLKLTVRCFFVPNSRVWDNAEKYTAQRGGASEIKIEEIPNIGGKIMPKIYTNSQENFENVLVCNTEYWRDAFISSYLPRISDFAYNESQGPAGYNATFPKVSVLPLRGYVAIFNDFFRHKEFEEERQEYKNDTVSDEEWMSYFPFGTFYDDREVEHNDSLDYYNGRAKREQSYYTDYRTEIQGFEDPLPTPIDSDKALLIWANWESKINETRAQAENAQMNDWDIIAKIRGSKVLTEGKVQLISQKTFNLNYAAITQNTYNNNSNVAEQFRVMGKQGAYSYTEVNIPLFAGMEFKEEGYLHIFATVSADTVFEKSFDRQLLNVTPLDEYRPDMQGDKYDVLYKIETSSFKPNDTTVLGFKRKYSEYFKLANVVSGDMTTDNYFTKQNGGAIVKDDVTITQKTFQFFENDIDTFETNDEESVIGKKIWKDYTDLMINKNQAIKNRIVSSWVTQAPQTQQNLSIAGQNQVFFVGVMTCNEILPINNEIEGNYTTWGEH